MAHRETPSQSGASDFCIVGLTGDLPLSTARILIVSNGALSRNPRVFKEATTLGNAGYEVTVLTLRNHRPSEAADLRLLSNAPFKRTVIDLLPADGARSLAIFIQRASTSLARTGTRYLGWQIARALGSTGLIFQEARRSSADLTIVHNEAAHWVGTRLLANGRRVAADIEDWHSEDLLPDDRRYRPLRLIRKVERTLLQQAAYTSTTSHALAAALHARYGGQRPVVITNSFPLQTLPPDRSVSAVPAFFWFSQTVGPGRGLEPFIRAGAQMNEPSRFVLI